MRTEDLDFPLPEELIARHPPERRGRSRLLVVHCRSGELEHRSFRELPEVLGGGDLLVRNRTRVIPALLRLRKESGGRVEGLFLEEVPGRAGQARLLLEGARLRPGLRLRPAAGEEPVLELLERETGRPGPWRVRFEGAGDWPSFLARAGATPLPPYIRRLRRAAGEDEIEARDAELYQTVWAEEDGAVAAPTASLHFDGDLLRALAAGGLRFADLILHVGAGTFLPVTSERLEDHRMHGEVYRVPRRSWEALQSTRRRGGRVVAAGTTVCRVLEELGLQGADPALEGTARIFLKPGSAFRWTDVLLTNFHTPRSTLLALVAAFAAHAGAGDGLAFVKEVYAEAVARRYRFYSYGDASLWMP